MAKILRDLAKRDAAFDHVNGRRMPQDVRAHVDQSGARHRRGKGLADRAHRSATEFDDMRGQRAAMSLFEHHLGPIGHRHRGTALVAHRVAQVDQAAFKINPIPGQFEDRTRPPGSRIGQKTKTRNAASPSRPRATRGILRASNSGCAAAGCAAFRNCGGVSIIPAQRCPQRRQLLDDRPVLDPPATHGRILATALPGHITGRRWPKCGRNRFQASRARLCPAR